MTSSLENWERPGFRQGGGDAFLFYVIYGPTPQSFSVSRSKYRFDGIPDGIELMAYGPSSSPEVVDSFREDYLWNELERNNADLAVDIAAQTECLIICGAISDPEDLNYLRNVIGIVSWLLDC